MKFKQLWDLESAMQILTYEQAEPEVWAEAVEWLILYGPPEIRKMLIQASQLATASAFPGLKPSYYTEDGEPVYSVSDLALHLNISEEEAKSILKKKELEHDGADVTAQDKSPTTVH